MRTSSAFTQYEREACTIVINGQKMTMKEYNEMKKKKEGKTKKEKTLKLIQTLSPYVTKIVKNVKVLKSAAAYYDNGPRQWGHICTDNIIGHPYISGPFIRYRMSAYDISGLLNDIDKLSRRNEKDIFQFIEKLSYKVDDARTHLNALVKGVNDSRVCEFYKEERCINETGRRLGLQELMHRALISMSEIEKLIKELDKIATGGVDVFDYDGSTNKRLYVR